MLSTVFFLSYTRKGKSNIFQIESLRGPRPKSSSISSSSSNSFKNLAWSCCLFLFNQYLYATNTPIINKIEPTILTTIITIYHCTPCPSLWWCESPSKLSTAPISQSSKYFYIKSISWFKLKLTYLFSRIHHTRMWHWIPCLWSECIYH